jgi:peptidoglycan hydrolase-like protein with peptidoglycan-binding domain
MKIAQDQHYEGDDWWKWSIWIDAPADELAQIDKVVWHLHPTFPEPVRTTRNRDDKFRLETSGWGTFTVRAEVWKGGEPIALKHELKLDYPERPLLKRGVKGSDIDELQAKLGIEVTGEFDAATEAAVRSFQESRGLPADGVVGPRTWEALDEV